MEFIYDDGGRSKYFKGQNVRDCVARAISIATESDYKEIYDKINEYAKSEHIGKRKRGISNARNGVYTRTVRKLMSDLGWVWHPTMQIGSGCKVHMKKSELPGGRIVASMSKHYACVIDGVLHDTYDCTRNETRCVYGYFSKG